MRDEVLKDILRTKLPQVSEDSVYHDNVKTYDVAYAVIRILTEKKIANCWSDVKDVLKLNQEIINKVENMLRLSCQGK